MKIIHLTDLHLSSPERRVWGLDPHARVGCVLDEVARLHGDAAFCVVSGDLANNCDPRAYRWLGARLRDFPLRTVLMTGNHDDRAAMRAELPGVMDDGAGFVQGAIETDEGVFLFLDTLDNPNTTSGLYCKSRRAWLRDRLEKARGRPVRLFMHHPAWDVGIPRLDKIRLRDAEKFAALLTGHDIRHIFFGHVHRPVYVNWHGIPCTALPGMAHQIPLNGLAARALFTDEPPMYAIVLIRGDSTIVSMDAPLHRRGLLSRP